MRSIAFFWLCTVLCFVCCCYGQQTQQVLVDTAPAPSSRFPASWYPKEDGTIASVAEPPSYSYTATLVTRSRFNDPSTGEQKTISVGTFQARDTAGRTRDETAPGVDASGGRSMPHEVTVYDAVSHCRFQWTEPFPGSGRPTAMATCQPRTLHFMRQNIWAHILDSKRTETHSAGMDYLSEPLGSKRIGMLEMVGERNTKTLTNVQTGEIRTLVFEVWYSPELKDMIEMKQVPGPNGKIESMPDFELTNIKKTTVDPALFYPPAGYAIESTLPPHADARP